MEQCGGLLSGWLEVALDTHSYTCTLGVCPLLSCMGSPTKSSLCPSIHKEINKPALEIPKEAKYGHMTILKPLRGNKKNKDTSPNSA